MSVPTIDLSNPSAASLAALDAACRGHLVGKSSALGGGAVTEASISMRVVAAERR